MSIRTVEHYLRCWEFTPQKTIRRAYEQRPEAVKQWLDERYPEIAQRARAEGGEFTMRRHWSILMCWSSAPKGKTPMSML